MKDRKCYVKYINIISGNKCYNMLCNWGHQASLGPKHGSCLCLAPEYGDWLPIRNVFLLEFCLEDIITHRDSISFMNSSHHFPPYLRFILKGELCQFQLLYLYTIHHFENPVDLTKNPSLHSFASVLPF